jgi:hypothetical protein
VDALGKDIVIWTEEIDGAPIVDDGGENERAQQKM